MSIYMSRAELEEISEGLITAYANKFSNRVIQSIDIEHFITEFGESFDTSFAFVFPLTRQMIRTKAEPNSFYRKYSSEELECAVGNYLISKGVPIIDYFSHMGYKYDILAENM